MSIAETYFPSVRHLAEPGLAHWIAKALLLTLEVVSVLLIIFFLLRLLVLDNYTVVGPSMVPTLENNEEVLVNKLSYRFRNPARGDIVVLVPPHDVGKKYVKRIIGLPGEKVQIKGDGQVIIYNDTYPSGIALTELYLADQLSTEGYVVETLAADEYFVMGDNRERSSDSRGDIGATVDDPLSDWTLPAGNIVGRVFWRISPQSKWTYFRQPDYAI